MDYRFLGNSGLQISTLTMGTMTFGGTSGVFKHVGNTDVEQAKKIISMCLEAGINIFDTADVYSDGQSEEILGTALTPEQRKKTLIATKVFGKMGPELHDAGLSRLHIIRA